MPDKEAVLREQIINTGKRLYDLRLVASRAGNLSARLDEKNILITATRTSLGSLAPADILKADLSDSASAQDKRLTTEFPVHNLIHKNFQDKCVIHCHPPLVNGYFSVCGELKNFTFESKLYLGNVPLVNQETPSISKPDLVMEALRLNNLAVIKRHGVVAISGNFTDALYLIEGLEEAIKIAAVARLFNKEAFDELDSALKEDLTKDDTAYPMFSREHVQAIVDLVNKDDFIAQKGRELDLTVQLAIRMDDYDKVYPALSGIGGSTENRKGGVYKFNFEKGRIARLDFDANAPFVISAPAGIWEQVFLGKLDSFVAVTQGKMKLAGQLGQLSKWYVPFTRLFALFKQVKIKV